MVQGCGPLLEKVGARRLLLEHTYVQVKENNIHNALQSYQMALSLPYHYGGRENMLLKSAGTINQLRFNQCSFADELGSLLVSSPPKTSAHTLKQSEVIHDKQSKRT